MKPSSLVMMGKKIYAVSRLARQQKNSHRTADVIWGARGSNEWLTLGRLGGEAERNAATKNYGRSWAKERDAHDSRRLIRRVRNRGLEKNWHAGGDEDGWKWKHRR
jgi:hypothetical protein